MAESILQKHKINYNRLQKIAKNDIIDLKPPITLSLKDSHRNIRTLKIFPTNKNYKKIDEVRKSLLKLEGKLQEYKNLEKQGKSSFKFFDTLKNHAYKEQARNAKQTLEDFGQKVIKKQGREIS